MKNKKIIGEEGKRLKIVYGRNVRKLFLPKRYPKAALIKKPLNELFTMNYGYHFPSIFYDFFSTPLHYI